MSQHDFEITTADANTGITFRAAANAALQALASLSLGTSEPSTKYAGQLWVDTTSGLLKMRNTGNTAWITIGTLDAAYLALAAIAAANDFTATQKLKGSALIWRFYDTGGYEYGIRSNGNKFEFLYNSGTEGTPSWTVIGSFDSSGILTIADGTALTSALSIGQYQSAGPVYAVASGTDTYAASLSPAISSYVTGAHYFITFTNQNTSTTPTLNINSKGAKTIKKPGGSALSAGDIAGNHPAILKYDGTDLILLNPALSSSSGGGGKIRQTVLNAAATSGLPSFISIGAGLSVNIDGSPTPVVISFAYGFDSAGPVDKIGAISSDTSISSLPASSTNYLYADRDISTGVITLGSTTYQPAYINGNEFKVEYSDTDTYDELIGYNSSNYYYGESLPSFTTHCNVSKITLRLKKVGSPTGTLSVEIQTDSGGLPSNTPITNGVSDSINEADLTTSYASYNFTFSTEPVLTPGTSYHIVLKFSGRSTSTSNYTKVSANSNYADGHGEYANSTPSWTTYSQDMLFSLTYYPINLFDLSAMKMYTRSGGSYTEKQRVFLGEAVTDGSSVTSVVNYALQGRYDTGDITTTATSTSKNHNIGADIIKAILLEGSPGSRSQIMSKDFTSISRNSITWSAVAGTSRLLVERGF